MSELTINTEFRVVRTSKNGRTVERDALGVSTSGNAAERGQLNMLIINKMIENNTFDSVMKNIMRVFSPASLRNQGVLSIGADYAVFEAETKTLSVLTGVWTATVSAAYCKAVSAKFRDKEIKGAEKVLYLEAARTLVDHVAAKEAAKAAAKLAQQ